jgi:chromosome partitioning protein
MASEGNDLRRRGRRLFASLRKQEDPLRRPDEAVPEVESLAPDGMAAETADGTIDLTLDRPETADGLGAETAAEPPESFEPAVGPSGRSVARSEARVASTPGPAPVSAGTENVATIGPDAEPRAGASLPEAEPPAPSAPPVPAAEPPPRPVDPAPVAEREPVPDGQKTATIPAQAAGDEGERLSAEPAAATPEPVRDVGRDEGPRQYDLPRILAVANQKGGVGKTTTTVSLGASLAELGFRVLIVDLDPQGNATTGLGINARNLQASVYDVIMNDAAVEDCVEPTSLKNLFLAPATIDLAGAEIELVPAFSRELKLRRALHEVLDEYDYIIIDCPPSLGLLTVNGLAAADDVIVPIQCEYYALEGLSQLVRNVTLVRTNLNPTLDVRGIVLTMYDARTKLADQVEQEVREHFGSTVYKTVIPRTVRLSEAPSFGQPITVFDPTSRGAIAYRDLAKEVSSGATRRAG